MSLRHHCKLLWKATMRMSLRIYSGNHSVYVYNDRGVREDGDIRRLYGQNADALVTERASYSQHGQDAYVLGVIYKGKRTGTFVDVGANHPVDCSNSYLLELHGWEGLAIEPQKSLGELWPVLRRTPCLDCAVGSESKEVVFVEADPKDTQLSGVEGFNKVTAEFRRARIQQRRLDDILDAHGISSVDYLSIDVEGYEMSVLRGIDFSKVDIRLIGIENDTGFRFLPFIGTKLGIELGSNTIRRYLKKKGYRYIARIASDDFFVKCEA